MTDQDFLQGPAQVEICPPNRYARAGARVDRDPAKGDRARARLLSGHAAGAAPPTARSAAAAPGERLPGGQRYTNGQFAPGPLAERAARIRALGHAALDAAGTLRDEIAAGADYVRSGAAALDKAGVYDPEATAAVRGAIAALKTAGDTCAAAMHAWRPAS